MLRNGKACRESGQSLVELALMLPFLALILLGILDLGRVFNAYITITNSAREGAFFASTCLPAGTCASDAPIKAWVQAEAAGSGIAISATDVQVTHPSDSPGEPVIVRVSVPFRALSTMIGSFWGGGDLTLTSEATVVIR